MNSDTVLRNRVLQRVRAFVRREHAWAEFWSGLVMMGWGMQSVLDTSRLSDNPPYQLVVHVVPEGLLEMIAIMVGVMQIWSILVEQTLMRALAALCASWFFAMLLLSFLSVHPWPPGWPLASGWVGINMFAFGRLLRGIR